MSARPEHVCSSSVWRGQTGANKRQDLSPWTLASPSLFTVHRQRSAFQVKRYWESHCPVICSLLLPLLACLPEFVFGSTFANALSCFALLGSFCMTLSFSLHFSSFRLRA